MDRYVQELVDAAKNMNRLVGCGLSGKNCSEGDRCPTKILYKAYKEVEDRKTQHYLIYTVLDSDSSIRAVCRSNVLATFHNSTSDPFEVNCKGCRATSRFRDAMIIAVGGTVAID